MAFSHERVLEIGQEIKAIGQATYELEFRCAFGVILKKDLIAHLTKLQPVIDSMHITLNALLSDSKGESHFNWMAKTFTESMDRTAKMIELLR